MGILSNLHLDRFSFWLGVLTGGLLFWYLSRFREVWPKIRQSIRMRPSRPGQNSAAGIEERLRNETLNQAQAQHLTAAMFSLDEILVAPRLMAPLPQVSPDTPLMVDDVVTQTIAYTPDWPELAAYYGGPTLDVYEPLKEGLNFAILGQPGAGKSTALAALASQIARRECPEPPLNRYLPVLIHIADLSITPEKIADPFKAIASFVAEKSPANFQSKIPAVLTACKDEGRFLLLLDGLDDLPASTVREACAFLSALLKQSPSIHVVVSASSEYFDGLTAFGIFPFTLAAWGRKQVEAFVNQWAALWKQAISPLVSSPGQIRTPDLDLVEQWLVSDPSMYTPLEWTLITWGAFAGDSLGPNLVDAIEAYIRRTSIGKYRPAFEQIARQAILEAAPLLKRNVIESALSNRQTSLEKTEPSEGDLLLERLEGGKKPIVLPEPGKSTDELIHSGLLVERPGDRFAFVHLLIAGYLASAAFDKDAEGIERLNVQQAWAGKSLTWRFMGALKDISAIVDLYVRDVEAPLYRNLLIAARWVKDAPMTMKWRTTVIQALYEVLLQDDLPMAAHQRALAALVCSHDQNLPVLFRQLISIKNSARSAQLGAIGLGALRDPRVVDDLIALLPNPAQTVRNAACLALAAIGNPPAIEAIAKVLIQADEITRRAAAESLANDPIQGYDVLKEGSVTGDVLIRRAVVFGLSRVRERWAEEILEKIRIEDGQWIVRNQASQALDALQGPNPYLPHLLPPPAQSPWLIEYAARQGVGIPGGSDARDLLLHIIRSGTEDEQLGALAYLRLTPEPDCITAINNALWTLGGMFSHR